jgi:hypothetical protein
MVANMKNTSLKSGHTGDTMKKVSLAALALSLMHVGAGSALAQNDKMTPITTPAQPAAITLDTGTLPGATAPEAWHRQYNSVFARNVTVATLTPFLPSAAKATGAAVIVAPGGGLRTLSMENEGWQVAQALAGKGVAAFVLKYRLNQTPQDMAGFERSMAEMYSATAKRPPVPQDPATAYAPQVADARAAFAPVRARAIEQGGHGFGMYRKTTTSTGWFDGYVRWLGMHGYLQPKR